MAVVMMAVIMMMTAPATDLDNVRSTLRIELHGSGSATEIVGGGGLRHRRGGAEREGSNGRYQYSFQHGWFLLLT